MVVVLVLKLFLNKEPNYEKDISISICTLVTFIPM